MKNSESVKYSDKLYIYTHLIITISNILPSSPHQIMFQNKTDYITDSHLQDSYGITLKTQLIM